MILDGFEVLWDCVGVSVFSTGAKLVANVTRTNVRTQCMNNIAEYHIIVIILQQLRFSGKPPHNSTVVQPFPRFVAKCCSQCVECPDVLKLQSFREFGCIASMCALRWCFFVFSIESSYSRSQSTRHKTQRLKFTSNFSARRFWLGQKVMGPWMAISYRMWAKRSPFEPLAWRITNDKIQSYDSTNRQLYIIMFT